MAMSRARTTSGGYEWATTCRLDEVDDGFVVGIVLVCWLM